MKITDKMPKKGQFVAIWKFDNLTWSNTFRYNKGSFEVYNDETDEYEQSDWNPNGLQEEVHYIKL